MPTNRTSEPPVHVLMRFSDALNPNGNTIEIHQQMIAEKGAVWFGKAGKPLGYRHVARISRQCEEHVPTFLYLVQRIEGQYELHKGSVLQVVRSLPSSERQFVPDYYSDLYFLKNVRYWTKLSTLTRAPKDEMEKLVLLNTGMPARLSLMHSMAGLFLVRRFRSP